MTRNSPVFVQKKKENIHQINKHTPLHEKHSPLHEQAYTTQTILINSA